jgi:hypothetical protein
MIPRTDDALTAMNWYMRLFIGAVPEAIAAPTLFIRPNEPLAEAGTPDFDWRARWELPHTVVDVPGDHMTMIDTHAKTTAQGVQTWLAEIHGSSVVRAS